MSANSCRHSAIKNLIKGKSCTVDKLRTDRRQRLTKKFKTLRIAAIDNLRGLKEEALTYEFLHELHKKLVSNLNENELVHDEEITDFLEDLKEEMKSIELEQYEKLCEEEIQTITENLMNLCQVCEGLSVENVCEKCQTFFL